MSTFSFTNQYLTKDGLPWHPVMGEMHYSRTDHRHWDESLCMMKAGGVDIVSSYVIWIHHEETEGDFDFSGNKNLREFVLACKRCGVLFFLRIGPWCHGEVRNGGFPDWVLQKDYEPRTNDVGYLADVERFYQRVYQQVEGLFAPKGGPIIGVQIENEYGHCGGLTGEAGEAHMRTLAAMAKEIGFDAPYYTATGWGGAITGGLLPVMGGYCDAPWDRSTGELPPSGNYIFTLERNDTNIGSDRGFGEGITYDIGKFPFLTAELGGGLQVTHHRRTVPSAADIGAMSLAKLGSGANLLGYYMYHGGTNPVGKLSTFQESTATGYPNDLPVLSYDFNAPIRESRQISGAYKEIKCLAMFLRDFGSDLCTMLPHIPEDNPLDPRNFTALRTSIRHNGKSGYVFVNNHQRHYSMAAHEGVVLSVRLAEKRIDFPSIDIADGDYFFYPFEMEIPGGVLHTATATPLCTLENDGERQMVFYTDGDPHFNTSGQVQPNTLICLTKQEALNAWKVTLDREYLIICENAVFTLNGSSRMTGTKNPKFRVYPDFTKATKFFHKTGMDGIFSIYEPTASWHPLAHKVDRRALDNIETGMQTVEIRVDELSTVHDWLLKISYVGDRAELYANGKLIADNFYTGQPWEVALDGSGSPRAFELRIYGMTSDQKVYLESYAKRENKKSTLDEVALIPVYQWDII